MNINEGYKSAVYKYNKLTNTNKGREFVSMLNRIGISKQHLLWAVENIEERQINLYIFIQAYKEWKHYVLPYYKQQNKAIPDISNLTYQEICKMIDECKSYWAYPNVVYNRNGITVCKLNNYQDAHMLPIETTWCITKLPKRFEKFCGQGKSGYYIVNQSTESPYQKVLAIIMNGEIEYWDSTNSRMSGLPDEIERFEYYESTLPKEVRQIFYNEAARQGEEIEESKLKNESTANLANKRIIPLTESYIRQIVRETLKQYIQL